MEKRDHMCTAGVNSIMENNKKVLPKVINRPMLHPAIPVWAGNKISFSTRYLHSRDYYI